MPQPSSFGAPTPLPNQKGFNKNLPSHQLEKQTIEMEKRLEKLKNRRMAEELENKERVRQPDGSNWKSGMSSRGSMYSYSKDVKNRQARVSKERRDNPRPKQQMSQAPSKGKNPGGSMQVRS